MLLDKDADVNAQGGHFGNTLQTASSGAVTTFACDIITYDLNRSTQIA
jgi:hypothetical protein